MFSEINDAKTKGTLEGTSYTDFGFIFCLKRNIQIYETKGTDGKIGGDGG